MIFMKNFDLKFIYKINNNNSSNNKNTIYNF